MSYRNLHIPAEYQAHTRIRIVGDQIMFDGMPVANLILSGAHGLRSPDVTSFVEVFKGDPERAYRAGYAEGYDEGSSECDCGCTCGCDDCCCS